MSAATASSMTNIGTAEHYSWGGTCDGWHLLATSALSVIQERMPPGTAEMRHYHHHAHQFFFVLAGALTLEIEGVLHLLEPHDSIQVRAGAAHCVTNQSGLPTEFLGVSSPPSHGDRVLAPAGQSEDRGV
jgi:mannose-6-phosphate isomerase-like protein (cupin superfamily)